MPKRENNIDWVYTFYDKDEIILKWLLLKTVLTLQMSATNEYIDKLLSLGECLWDTSAVVRYYSKKH